MDFNLSPLVLLIAGILVLLLIVIIIILTIILTPCGRNAINDLLTILLRYQKDSQRAFVDEVHRTVSRHGSGISLLTEKPVVGERNQRTTPNLPCGNERTP